MAAVSELPIRRPIASIRSSVCGACVGHMGECCPVVSR